MKKTILILSLLWITIFAQNQEVVKDTSYTVRSTYKKLIKDYPFISIVKPILPNGVNALREIGYVKYRDRELKLDIFFQQETNFLKPAVILVHGGGWRTGDKSLMFPMALKLAESGYVTAAVEYRLAPGAIFPAAVIDVNTSIKWLKQNAPNFGIDTSRIALLGCSAGGQIASLVGFGKKMGEFQDKLNYPDISNNGNT